MKRNNAVKQLRCVGEPSVLPHIGRVLKSKKHEDLYQWLISNTPTDCSTITERVALVIHNRSDYICERVQRRKYTNSGKFGFCENTLPEIRCDLFRLVVGRCGIYKAMGSEFSYFSSPNYWYLVKNRVSRYQYRKHMLPAKIKHFDKEKTEEENMRANGYYRVYDCGNSVWVYNNTKGQTL